jgi:hypothetical protein
MVWGTHFKKDRPATLATGTVLTNLISNNSKGTNFYLFRESCLSGISEDCPCAAGYLTTISEFSKDDTTIIHGDDAGYKLFSLLIYINNVNPKK